MKNKTLILVKSITPVAVFNIIFFITWGIHNPASVWVSYGLTHFAYLLFVLSTLFNKSSPKNPFFSFTNKLISLIYCILQFVAGLTFIILHMENVNICLYVQLPLLAVYAIVIACNVNINDKTHKNTEFRQEEIDFIKQCTLELDLILLKPIDNDTRKNIVKAKELIASSPSKSYPEAKPIEKEIISQLDEMKTAEVLDASVLDNLATALIHSINKRNLTLKSLH